MCSEELIEQNKLLLEAKKKERILLRDFETKFEAENGRYMSNVVLE